MCEWLYDKLDFENKTDVYAEIKSHIEASGEKLYIWGVGSVAVGAFHKLRAQDIEIAGFFVNVENYTIDPRLNGYPTCSLDELCARNEPFSVIVGHSCYELARSIQECALIQKIWALPAVVRPDVTLSEDFIRSNMDGLQYTFEQLADQKSRQNMVDFLNVHLTQDTAHIMDHFEEHISYFENDVFRLNDSETYVDMGAYDGASMCSFLKAVDGKYHQIVAVEVLPNEAEKLKENFKNRSSIRVVHSGISNHVGTDYFAIDHQGTCLADEKCGVPLPVTTLDRCCSEFCVAPTLIKICIGNSIAPILCGAKGVLSAYTPKLVIAAGIDRSSLMQYIPEIENAAGKGRYRFYLRFANAIAEQLLLFAVPKDM